MTTALFKNVAEIVTMDDQRRRPQGYDLLVQDGKVAAIEKEIELPKDTACELIDGKSYFMFPGLINTHHHFIQVLTRNIPAAQGAELFTWLEILYPLWARISRECVYYSSLVACGELLKTGCTTTVDQFYAFPQREGSAILEEEFRAAEEIGIRFHGSRGSMSLSREEGGLPPKEVVQTSEEILKDTQKVIEAFHDPSPCSMSRVIVAPCSPFSVTEELMRESIALARDYKVLAHTHLAETEDEEEYCRKKFGLSPLEYMEMVGWIGEDVWFAHGVHLKREELKRMAKARTGVAHCPVSNMKLASGVAPIPEMLELGVPVGLAVDGSASNDSSNMIAEMKTCLLLHKLCHGIDAISPEDVLYLATRGGAEILKQPEIGSLSVGQAADLFLLDKRRLALAGGLMDPVLALLQTGTSQEVDLTMVGGRIVVHQGELTTINELRVAQEANELALKIQRR